MKLAPILAVALAGCVPGQAPDSLDVAAAEQPPRVSDLASANAEFGIALYRQLADEPGNLVISPISIAGAMAPVAEGAQGATRQAIDRAMRFPPESVRASGALLRDLAVKRDGARVSIANALWVQRGFPLKPAFLAVARKDFGAVVEPLDFGQPKVAGARINDWVSRATEKRIPTLIDPSSLGEQTALVVTNAVYLLADWALPFNAGSTSSQPFYGRGGSATPARLMYRKSAYRYFEDGSVQGIELPYRDGRLAMSIILPRVRNGMDAIEKGVTAKRLADWLGRLDAARQRTIYLYLPKVTADAAYQLEPALTAMGMGNAFSDRADLRGIADARLRISQVVHKTFLRIDEKGTEAAAATGVEIELVGGQIPAPPTFRADHPFLFILRDKPTGAVLFLGRIEAPGAA